MQSVLIGQKQLLKKLTTVYKLVSGKIEGQISKHLSKLKTTFCSSP